MCLEGLYLVPGACALTRLSGGEWGWGDGCTGPKVGGQEGGTWKVHSDGRNSYGSFLDFFRRTVALPRNDGPYLRGTWPY